MHNADGSNARAANERVCCGTDAGRGGRLAGEPLTVQTEAQDEALTDAAEESEALPAQEQVLQAEAVSPALQSGAALIPAGSDENAVKLILAQALISNSDQFSEEELLGLEWEYYCEGKNGLLKNSAWGSVNGFVSKKVLTNYTHPALVDNGNGNYQIRLAGTAQEVTLEKKDKLDSSIVLNEGVSVSLPYTEDSTIDYAQLEAKVFEAVVAEIHIHEVEKRSPADCLPLVAEPENPCI